MAGLLLLVFLILSTSSGLKISGVDNLTDEQYNRFPRLFHLDDYERCLAQQNGLYCIGTFTLTAAEDSTTFELMKAYSENPANFNRTLLHRGYCVSERCPLEQNATLRFERCVAKHARRYSLSAHLRSAECTTHKLHQAETAPDAAQSLFINVLYIILLLNILGTVYDVNSNPEDNKWRLLKCWSVPANWRKMMNSIDMNDSGLKQLATIQGVRALGVILVLGVHVIVGRTLMYAYHPHFIEVTSFGLAATNSVSMLHTFIMISSFLTTFFIITLSEKQELSIKVLPLAIFKRVIRVSPTYIFMVGYAATWWYRLADGPLWSSVVGVMRNNCRQKFWAHTFYVNNLIDNSDGYCLAPTWFLAADLHTNIVVSALSLIMARWGRKALVIHASLFTMSCIVISALVYANEWKPMLYTTGPEYIRTLFSDDPSYHHLYMSSWILLPACFLGMFLAHLHVELQKAKFKLSDHKWIRRIFDFSFAIFLAWLLAGIILKEYTSPIAMALHTGLHRPAFCVLIGFGLIVSFNYQEHFVCKIFAWKFWHVLSRLSLPVLMIHWFVLITMAASTRHAISSTLWDMLIDWLVVVVTSYAIAIPVTVLLEIPAQRFLGTLVFRHKVKAN